MGGVVLCLWLAGAPDVSAEDAQQDVERLCRDQRYEAVCAAGLVARREPSAPVGAEAARAPDWLTAALQAYCADTPGRYWDSAANDCLTWEAYR